MLYDILFLIKNRVYNQNKQRMRAIPERYVMRKNFAIVGMWSKTFSLSKLGKIIQNK